MVLGEGGQVSLLGAYNAPLLRNKALVEIGRKEMGLKKKKKQGPYPCEGFFSDIGWGGVAAQSNRERKVTLGGGGEKKPCWIDASWAGSKELEGTVPSCHCACGPGE